MSPGRLSSPVPRRFAWRLLLVASTVAVGQRCGDAPRDNPLDPRAGWFAPVEGQVLSLFPPHRPLQGVQVFAPDHGVVDTTGSDGKFSLVFLPPDTITLVAIGVEFSPCTLSVPPNGPSRNHVEVYLNGLPRIVETSVTSRREELWGPQAYREWIDVSASVTDPDGLGDVDSVWCTVAGIRSRLAPQATLGLFRCILTSSDFASNAESLLGAEFMFLAQDRQGAFSAPKAQRLVRIVREVGILTSPVALEEVGPTPTLRWIPPAPEYPSVLQVTVVRIDAGVETIAWESPLLPALTDSAQVTPPLALGTHYWALKTIDSFGNSGRSREAAFRVTP